MFKTDLCNYSGQDSGRRSVWNKAWNLHMCFPQGATRSQELQEPSVEHIKIKLVTKKKPEAPSPDFTIVIVCDGKHH